MQPLTAPQIRSSLLNASRSEASKLNLPKNLETLDWENMDFLGWRDPKMPLRGYLILPSPKGLHGIMLRAPEGGAKKNRRVLCELCRDVASKEEVLLWVAKRAGQSGRNGNTIGTLICADFQCSSNVRKPPAVSAINPDPDAVVLERTAALIQRTELFLERVQNR
ncbi:FBP domain-containing protein [Pseudarthrobacter sp. J1738]|uniref:FBP domain-containing protein n=1 Tax=unclassified Pseudarthrobacter TaxID=2647000 RepID=UPI003D2B1979